MGSRRSRRDAVASQLGRALQHLLKLEHSRSEEPRRQWMITIRGARSEAAGRLTGAIKAELAPLLPSIYKKVRRLAALALEDYGEEDAASGLPHLCPYSLDQILDQRWLPASRHGLTAPPPRS